MTAPLSAPLIEHLDADRLRPGMLLGSDGGWGLVLEVFYGATTADRVTIPRAWVEHPGGRLECVYLPHQVSESLRMMTPAGMIPGPGRPDTASGGEPDG